MDLNYGAEYEEFRQDVQAFCKEYQGVSFKSESTDNQMNDALSGSSTTEKTAKEVTRSEWQKILIEKGFIARAIPKNTEAMAVKPISSRVESLQRNSLKLRFRVAWVDKV